MSDGITAMLVDATSRLFAEQLGEQAARRGRAGEWLGDGWAAVEEMGLPLALVDESTGGLGIAAADAMELIRTVGRHAVPLPIAETMMANHALAAAGLPLAEGPAAIVPAGVSLVGDRLSGTAPRVPWGGSVTTLVVQAGDLLVRLDRGWSVESEGSNIGGMRRDTLRVDAWAEAVAPLASPPLLLAGATARALLMSGAIFKALDLTIGHVNERVQFGRTLGKFQVVQHELAKVAGHAASSAAAADLAAEAFVAGSGSAIAVAAARLRIAEAVGETVSICQQMHGAIGFTAEHPLHLYTTALLGWREEYGGQLHWSDLLGRSALAAGPDGFWRFLCAA